MNSSQLTNTITYQNKKRGDVNVVVGVLSQLKWNKFGCQQTCIKLLYYVHGECTEYDTHFPYLIIHYAALSKIYDNLHVHVHASLGGTTCTLCIARSLQNVL